MARLKINNGGVWQYVGWGEIGTTGYTGYTGYTGLGETGYTGYTGYTGITGYTGTEFTWRGAYNAGTAYSVNNTVQYNGSGYVCIQAGTGQTPAPAGTAYWDLLVQGTDTSIDFGPSAVTSITVVNGVITAIS
jgi:hypothetical protein